MHPEVRKFYENSDCTVGSIVAEETDFMDASIYWTVRGSKHFCPHIVGATLGNGTNIYWWDGKKYSEEGFLKILKLKAFL
jgi:hypothetical protein